MAKKFLSILGVSLFLLSFFLVQHLNHFSSVVFAEETSQTVQTNQTQAVSKETATSAGLANPAASFCKSKGYKYKIEKKDNGNEYGICVLPDNTVCEAWAFYKKKCGQKYYGRKRKEGEKKGSIFKGKFFPKPGTRLEIGNKLKKINLGKTKISGPKHFKPVAVNLPSRVVSICAIADKDIRELEALIAKRAKISNLRNTSEEAKKIDKRIREIKNKIELKKKECRKKIENSIKTSGNSGKELAKKTLARKGFCETVKRINKKIDYYKKLLRLKAEELKEKGYDKKEIGKILGELQHEREKAISICYGKKIGWGKEIVKPVVPEKSKEVVDYYKEKFSQVIEKNMPADSQVKALTDLKKEIDSMIKELVRTKNEFSLGEVQSLVDKITVKPGAVKISEGNDVKVEKKKKIQTEVRDKKMEMIVGKKKLVLDDNGVEAKTSLPVSLENKKLLVKGKEVKVMPKELVKKVKIKNPINLNIELSERNKKPVYNINTIEKRKLLFFIPVKVKRSIVVDATSEETKKIEEKKPWWSFLAF